MDKILLIEDDPYMLESLDRFLKSEGFSVVAVSDGFKAIETAQENEFALVIADIRMAGMDGIEALGRVGIYQPEARKIVITAYADQDAPLRAIRISADDYLMKPFGSEAFLKSVRGALARYRLEQEKAGIIRTASVQVTKLARSVVEASQEKLPGGEARFTRFSALCARVGEAAGLSGLRLERLEKAVLWHDFFFVLDPDSHAGRAAHILSQFPEHEETASILRFHHDRSEEAPVEARILGLCEAYQSAEAGKSRTPREALDFLSASNAGDPDLLVLLERAVLVSSGEPTARGTYGDHGPKAYESLLHLAQVYSLIGETELADAALTRVRGHDEASWSEDFRCRFLLVSAQQKIRERKFVEGYQVAEEALELALSAGLGAAQVARIFLELALAKLFLSDPSRAEEMLEKAREIFGKAEDRRNMARAELYLALYDLAHGGKQRWRSLLESVKDLIGRDQMEDWLQTESFAIAFPSGAEAKKFLSAAQTGGSGNEIRVYSLGPFRIYRNGTLIKEEEWKSRKVKLLLAYLLFNMERPVSEERLCERFWPEGVERSRKNLHQTVYLLRRTLETNLQEGNQSSYILPQRSAYQFNKASRYWWDVAEFKKCRHEADQYFAAGNEKEGKGALVRMEELYQGDLLEDYPEETWCEFDRDKLKEVYLDGSLRLAICFENESQFKPALDLIGRVISRNPLHEMAAVQQVRVLFKSGMRSEAIRKYHEWCDTFKRELKLGPPPGLVSLYLEMTGQGV